LTGKSISGVNDAKLALQEIFARGAGSVALSLGRDGLLWRASPHGSAYLARAPIIEARSAVGSGDATLAGLAQSISRRLAPDETARLAAACGAANCLAESPGKINHRDVQELMKATTVETLP
jgi:fructose-1-phosphate kinase PfkB-like protein